MSGEWRKGRRVAVVGGGPGGLSAALACLKAGYDVRIYERQSDVRAIGGAVLLNIPVLMILRYYGIELSGFSAPAHMWFGDSQGHAWAELPAPADIERKSGINGFTHGVLRSSAFRKMKDLLPDGVTQTGHRLARFEDDGEAVTIHFENGATVDADLLIGADGIQSVVSRQLFGDPGLFHLGFKLWLAHCGDLDTVPRHIGRLSFTPTEQISYFPMVNGGQPGFEWWICEPHKKGAAAPDDIRAHLSRIAGQVDGPVRDLIAQTHLQNIFQWEIYNRRESLSSWCRGRVACVGDAVHPVSPYAGYGMGMAIEDGYFLGKFLGGSDLQDPSVIASAFHRYEETRIDYVNGHLLHARQLGRMIHNVPRFAGMLRNFIFRHTGFIRKNLEKSYLADAIKETHDLAELHVNR